MFSAYMQEVNLKHFIIFNLFYLLTNQERPTCVEWCFSIPTCIIFSSMFFTMGNWESLHDISLLRQGKSN